MSAYPTPQIGFYQSECCLLDLYKIETQQDLDNALERVAENDENGSLMVFSTLAEGIANLRGELSQEEERSAFQRLGWIDQEGEK